MRWLIGIDDTDNLESRGTGHRARQLAQALDGLLEVTGITRHQLLVDPRIPYTSHNSSACLTAEGAPAARAEAIALSREFLLKESAPGSDAGLCVAAWEQVTPLIQAWGARAKAEVLVMADALALAAGAGVHLEGLTGTHGGVIGALAAAGLRAAGADGRYLWLRGLRELSGIYTAAQLQAAAWIEVIQTEAGAPVSPDARILVGDWPRPILRGGQAVLLVEEAEHVEYDWRAASKERIKQLTG